MNKIRTISFHTLGCKLNFSESSSLSTQLSDKGYSVVPFDQSADLYIINTCSVTEFADRKCRKAVNTVKKRNPQAKVIMMGCYAQLQPEEIAKIENVDLVLGAKEKFRLVEHVQKLDCEPDYQWVVDHHINEVTEFNSAYSFEQRTRSFLKIQDGCDYKCSFCTIPQARGISRSNTINGVVEEAQQLIAKGAKEIVLTGVNIGDFGKSQTPDEDFFGLIKRLDKLSGDVRFRISSIEPNLCSNEIIDFVAASHHFMPHFHMPLQSGNDETLRKMRRRYTRDLYRDRVSRIKSIMPHACIGVDVIVGFPGETEEHFQDSYDFLKGLDVSYLHVFTFSARANTPAEDMIDQVDIGVRRARNKRLTALSEWKRRKFYAKHIGETRWVILEPSKQESKLQGFTENYIKVSMPKNKFKPNDAIPVRLTELDPSGTVHCTPVRLDV